NDGTLYSCLTGVAFAGPKKGEKLTAVPTLVNTWGNWLATYPQAVAYHMFDKYTATELSDAPNSASVKSRGSIDKRLPAETGILGIVVGKSARAYTIEQVANAKLLHDDIDGRKCVVLWHDPSRCAVAYHPVAVPPKHINSQARTLTLEHNAKEPNAPFRDKE